MWERLEAREIRRRGITRPDPGGRPRPDLPEGADLLPQIRHIVVLMMENHSYDNYLGLLADRGEGLPLGPDGTPDVVNYAPNGRGYHAHQMTSTTQVKNNPSQNWRASHAGRLPAVSIVDPDFETYSEENPQDIRRGESFAAEVINHVMHGPAWSSTLLIWLYDEHGGYYDHVPPPEAVPPDDVPAHNYVLDLPRWLRTLLSPVFGGGFTRLKAIDDGPRDYARYGFRVPAVVVCPYARPDYVCSTTLDHTSVLKLIEEKWNLPPLTRRDAAAAAPLDMVDLDAEPAFAEPPKLPEPALRWGSWGSPRRRRAGATGR